MFLNFLLHKELQRLSGVDVTHAWATNPSLSTWESGRRGIWERWNRNVIGLTDSPYRSIQWMIRLKMEAYSDRGNRTNPFHWNRVALDLPGKERY